MMSTVSLKAQIIWILVNFVNYGCCGVVVNETQLIRDLLRDYEPDARPVNNQSDSVRVELQMIYKELKEIEEPKQQMTSITRFRIKWNDISLRWRKEDYGGVKAIRLEPTRIWTPDLTLYNSVHKDGGNIYSYLTKAMVSYDGNVTWLTYAMLQTTCKLDISAFPVDDQKCTLKIGSWTLSTAELDLRLADDHKQPNLAQYSAHTEWNLISATATSNIAKYPCCPELYTDITFTLHFRRKPWFYIVTIVLPCIILSLLAAISFLFPAGSGERVSLVISVLLGLTVFMLIINAETPVTSDSTPMLTRYFNVICCGTFVILLLTAFILQIHHGSSSEPVPSYLANMRHFFVSVLCMKASQKPAHEVQRKQPLVETLLLDDEQRFSFPCVDSSVPVCGIKKRRHTTDIMLMSKLQLLTTRMEENDLSDQVQKDWQYTARVFDRLLFFIFVLFYTGLNLYIIAFLYT